jgi:hypothetical protein
MVVAQVRVVTREEVAAERERRERFQDPLKQLKERSREVFEAVAEKARRRGRQGPAREPNRESERGQSGDKKRGMFDGLRLRSERLAAPAERDLFSQARSSATQEPTPRQC